MDCATEPSVHDIIHKRTSEEDFTEQEENETNGLDFRLVRKVLELYEGRLTQSEFRDGFVFRISFKEENQIAQSADLPALTSKFESEYNKKFTDSDMEPAITDDMFSVGGRPPVILLAEENIMVMKFMEGLLHGHCVLYTMSSGADAWNFLQSNGHKPDIIICNYILPVISGMELFRKCSDVISLQDIPFILMLPLSEASKQNEFIRRGAAACLIPPFTKDELYRTIYTIYSLSKMIQRNVFSIVNKALYGNKGASDDADTRTETQERRTVEPGQKLISGSSDISLTDSQKTLFDEHELSARERQIAMLISQGLSDKEIADNLCISPGTVVTHKKNVFKKLDVHSRVQLMAKIR
jgi:DNA-binding NarL/FixJ family response regulator